MTPPLPSERPVRARLARFVAPRPSFEDTCNDMAQHFRTLAQAAYDDGDQGRGDYYTTRALAWELARDTNDLTVLRERP